MKTLKQLKKYPLIALFFAFLFIVAIIDTVTPDKAVSELENRNLTQRPTLSLAKLWANEWTKDYGEYIRDQFWLRDEWVGLHSMFEAAQGKLEAGGVWLAEDGYQIAKNDSWSATQQTLFPANTGYVGEFAARWPGRVQAMIIPSPANILSGRLREAPYQIDENALMDEMFGQMAAAGAGVIDLRQAFSEADAAGRQVYYRTDHHWTTDGGAAIAYEAFCAAVGRQALMPNASGRVEVPGFYGTNYSKTLWPATVPDTLVYYDVPNPMTIYRIDAYSGKPLPEVPTLEALLANGNITQQQTGVMDKAKLSVYDKYAAFLHGNNGYSVIQGNGAGSVLVLKDSYGNSFVPYLVENYATIGVLDLRSWPMEPDALIEEGGYEDILVLYSFASFTQDNGVRYMRALEA